MAIAAFTEGRIGNSAHLRPRWPASPAWRRELVRGAAQESGLPRWTNESMWILRADSIISPTVQTRRFSYRRLRRRASCRSRRRASTKRSSACLSSAARIGRCRPCPEQRERLVELTAAIGLSAAKLSAERRLPMAGSIMLASALAWHHALDPGCRFRGDVGGAICREPGENRAEDRVRTLRSERVAPRGALVAHWVWVRHNLVTRE